MGQYTAIGEIIAAEVGAEAVESFSELESRVREVIKQIGKAALAVSLAKRSQAEEAQKYWCECGQRMHDERQRTAQLQTLFGVVVYQRAIYVCGECGTRRYPLDEQLGLRPNAMSAEVERLAGLLGSQMPFGKGSRVFEELTLVCLSDHSLNKATQAYGRAVEEQEADWRRQAEDPEELLKQQREKKRPRRLYGSIDGGLVPTRAETGEPQPWRELKVGAWFVARGQPPSSPKGQWKIRAEQITYYAEIGSAEDFGSLLWASGVQRQAQLADELIFLGDGAHWIWDLVDLHFPQAIQIVDWFHACQYLAPVAQFAFTQTEERLSWVEQMKTALWEGQLDTVIAACQKHIVPNRDKDPAQQAVTYYTNNRHRMDYPAYRANGYHIGSGTIESGVKQIASQRLKVSGARWNLSNARLVAKARAAFLSGQWPLLALRRRAA